MKHPVILDACTIINLLRIDVEDEFLFRSIKTLDLHIANSVYQEVRKNISKLSSDKRNGGVLQSMLPYTNPKLM